MELVIEIKNAMRTGLGAPLWNALDLKQRTAYLLFDSDHKRETTVALTNQINLSFSVT